jgi:anti-anti-sigma factor
MADANLSHQTVQQSPKVVMVRIEGEAHVGNGLQIENYFDGVLQSEEPQYVLLDLSDLTFAGSAFLSSLLFWREEMAKRGGKLVLYGVRPEIYSTMRILTLDRVLTLCPDQQAGLAAVGT